MSGRRPWVGKLKTAYEQLFAQIEAREARTAQLDPQRWEKSEHLARMQACGRFRYVKELCLHHRELGNDERLVGTAITSSSLGVAQLEGVSDQELGLDRLRAEAERLLGADPKPWYWSYRVRVAVK